METNLARLAETALDRLGDHPSLYFEGTWHSSGQLLDRAARLATGLRDLGIRPGDRVAVIMANCAEVGVTYAAVWRAGAVVTPVVFLVSALELRHILRDSGAVAVVTSPELLPKVNEALAGETGADSSPAGQRASAAIRIIVADGGFGELEHGDPAPIVQRGADDLAALLYTGGTTGRSKGVALSHANLSNAGASSRRVSHIPGLVRGLSALPLSHSFGLLVTVGNYHVPEPGVSVLQRWFQPQTFVQLAAEQRVQTAAVVPSMLVMLLGQPLEEYDLSSLRYVFSGAAPLSRAVALEFERRVPSARVLEGYGCTETSGIISSTPPAAPRPGTVGKAVPNVDIRIVGPDGLDVPVGGDGEVVVRGPNIMLGYWNGSAPAPDPLDPALDPTDGADGEDKQWLHTGDVGRLDEDGYLTIVDRIKDLIIRGGYNVYPRDVEDSLLEHPDVYMAAVIGRPDERLGEEVVAFVALNEGADVTDDDLIGFTRERLAAHKYPREVHIVDAIPLTSVGKLDRKRLRATATGD